MTTTLTVPIHSHSALERYSNCPKQYNHITILKDVKDQMGAAGVYGDMVHKAVDAYLKSGAPLPPNAAQYKQLVDLVRDIPCDYIHTELRLSVRRDGTPCTWFDKTGYLRGIVDVVIVRGTSAIVLDWKTGASKYGTKEQDLRSAWLVFAHYPQVQTIDTRWVYFKDNKIARETVTRDDIPRLRASVDQLDSEVRWSLEHDSWPTRPSPLCDYCAVAKAGKCADAQKRRR